MKDIKKTQEVTIFPEDPTVSRIIEQTVVICDDGNWVLVYHDGQELSMSLENFHKLQELNANILAELKN